MPKSASQHFLSAIVGAGLLFSAPCVEAQNKYDILARVLQPYGALFYSKATTRALQTDLILRKAPPSATAILNQPLRIFLQIPDKLRIETLDPQHRLVLCRNGQKVWVYPNEFFAGLVPTGRRSGKPGKIPDFHLPIKDQQIVWIPALFQILNFESVAGATGAPMWAIDFQLVPEVAQVLKCDTWTIRVIVNQGDFQVQHLQIESSSWSGALDILDSRFDKAFPAQTWEPGPELANQTAAVPPELFDSALEAIAAVAIPR
jgi:hypothetical protein